MAYSKIKKTHGIVLSEANSGDYDKVITILTSNMGKITAFAKGARRPKSNLLAATQVFSFSSFVLYEGSTMYYINSAEIVDVFYDIRFDYSKMDVGFKILKILKSVSPENMEVYTYMKLGVFTLNYLAKKDKDLNFVFNIFIARLLYEMGLGLNLKESKKEETEEKKQNKVKKENKKNKGIEEKFCIYFENIGVLKEYRYEDEKIKEEDKKKAKSILKNEKIEKLNKKYLLNINIFKAIKYIYNSKIEDIFNFNLEDDVKKEFAALIKEIFTKEINIKI